MQFIKIMGVVQEDLRKWADDYKQLETDLTAVKEREQELWEHLKIIKRNIDAGAVNNFWIRDYINTALERKEG